MVASKSFENLKLERNLVVSLYLYVNFFVVSGNYREFLLKCTLLITMSPQIYCGITLNMIKSVLDSSFPLPE